MRPLVLALGVIFGTIQTVSFTDCCCGSFCETPNSPSGCRGPGCSGDKGCAATNDAESTGGGAPSRGLSQTGCTKNRCAHLDPQREVEKSKTSPNPSVPLLFAILPL